MTTGDSDIPPIPTPTPEQAATPPVEPTPAAAPEYSSAPPPPPQVPGQAPPVYSTPTYSPGPTPGGYQREAYQPGAYTPANPQGLSIASLICGIGGIVFSFFGLGLFPSIAAVITGHLARKRQPWARGLWLGGMITGYVGLGISIIAGIVIVVFFALIFAHTSQYNDYGGYNA